MAIELRVAKTEREVDDALWVRHEVFVVEDGKFGGTPLHEERIVDRFDAFPDTHNIVAYEGNEPIATIRLVKEAPPGLPAEEYFDFEQFRQETRKGMRAEGDRREPSFGSAGMLAVRQQWRARRDVIRAMLKVAAGVSFSGGVTHIILVVSHETASVYRRLGFTEVAGKFWVEDIGDYVVSLATSVDTFHAWAFGDLPKTPLDTFKDSFQRLFLKAGEVICHEGDPAHQAFIVDSGTVRISRMSPSGEELTLTHLTRGDLFGELSLVDDEPRSATATATTEVELITLDRKGFLEELYSDPKRINDLLSIFSQRIRRMDDFAMMLAFAPVKQRLDFALRMARNRAAPDRKHPGRYVFRGTAEDLATSAAVDADIVVRFLDERRDRGDLDYNRRQIMFLR